MLLNLCLVAIVIILLVFIYPSALVAWQTTQQVRQCLRVEDGDAEMLPSNVKAAFEPYVQGFKALEFRLTSHNLLHTGTASELPAWGLLFHDPSQSCFGGLASLQPFRADPLLIISFTSILADGTIFSTSNQKNYGVFKPVPWEIKQNLINGSIETLWQAHQTKLAELSTQSAPIVLSGPEFLAKLTENSIQTSEFAVSQGEMKWVEQGKTVRWGLKPAIKLVSQITAEVWLKKSPKATVSVSAENQIESEVQAFLQELAPKPETSKKKRGWLALGSLAIFVAIYAREFDFITLLAFVGALILHEGGHLLAMIGFGYRSPTVFFLPYFGALATAAQKPHASLTEKVWISLAGPLPGLILGIGIAILQQQSSLELAIDKWYTASNTAWRAASSILIFLNLFNLLPIYPLDGGQVAELLVFSRNSYLGLIYKSLGLLLLIVVGLGLSQPLMFAFAIVIALTIPSSFRTARWFAKLRKELREIPWQDDEASARLIFTRLQTAPKLNHRQKNTIATGIFEVRREDRAPWTSRLGLLLIYIVSLLGGLIGALYSFIPNFPAVIGVLQGIPPTIKYATTGPKAIFREAISDSDRAIQANPQDWEAYLRRSGAKHMLKDFRGALADADYVVRFNPNFHKAYTARSVAYDSLGETAKANADRKTAKRLIWTPRFQAAQATLKKNPKDPSAYRDRAAAKHNLGDPKGAIKDLDQSLKLKPKDYQTLLTRSFTHQAQKNLELALQDANLAIQLQPKNPLGYEFRAELYWKLDQTENAIADEKKAEEIYENRIPEEALPEISKELSEFRSQELSSD